MKKWRVICVLTAVLLAFSVTIGYADTIDDKKKELKDVKDKIEKAKGDISKVEAEHDKILGQVAEIELDLSEKEGQLNEIEKSLDILQESIETTATELKEAEEKAQAHKKLMDERICAMYMSTGTSNIELLEIMLEAKNITDFLDRLTMVREIISLDKQVFDEMEAIKKEVEEQKEALELEKDIEEGTKEYIEAQKSLIEEKQEEKEALLAELEEKRDKLKDDLGELESTSESIESTIRRLEAERAQQNNSTSNRGGGSRDDGSSVGDSGNGETVSGGASAVVSVARAQLGKRYSWGAEGPNAFDCSGLVCYVYRQVGISGLPHSSAGQSVMGRGTRINNKNALKPGDLVFFYNSGGIGHVGIYSGGGMFIHAQNSRTGVVESSLNSGSYSRRFAWGRRIVK